MKMKVLNLLALIIIYRIDAKTIIVDNSKQLLMALKDVEPGDTIELSDGKYRNEFIADKSGTKTEPITLIGSRKAIISGYNYGFWLKASHWILMGFTVANSKKGIVLDGASHNLLDDLEVQKIKQEGVHFRLNSCDNILQHSYIHDTGKGSPGYGEGVYIGSAKSNWQNGPDQSDRNQVINNRIGPNVAAEEIDIKEGSCCGLIKGNTFDGTGMSGKNYADSWIDLKGTEYTIENNIGNHSLLDGIQVHSVSDSVKNSGCHNVIKHNKCSRLKANGKCVNDMSKKCTNKNLIIEGNLLK